MEQIKPLLNEKPVDPKIRRRERSPSRPSLEELFSDVSNKETRSERIHQAVRFYYFKLREVGGFRRRLPGVALLNRLRHNETRCQVEG